MMPLDVVMRGPFFDGRGEVIVDRMTRDVQMETAKYALAVWDSLLEGSIRRGRGVYQSFTHIVRRDPDVAVNDGWGDTNHLPYGPWLEGVGSRNSPVTRFPGYFALHRAFVMTDRAVPEISAPIVEAAMEQVNGD